MVITEYLEPSKPAYDTQVGERITQRLNDEGRWEIVNVSVLPSDNDHYGAIVVTAMIRG